MTAVDEHAFGPADVGPTGLFLDTSGLFPYFYASAEEHETIRTLFGAVRAGEVPYRPLVTNTYVVDELATLLLSVATHDHATRALEALAASDAITVEGETADRFDAARTQFLEYDDRDVSFTDHYCIEHMRELSIDHVLAYDGDFTSFGLEVIPRV